MAIPAVFSNTPIKTMSRAVIWNVLRAVLILVGCHQLGMGQLDSLQASRILSRADSPASPTPEMRERDAEAAIHVLNRRRDASNLWLVVVCVVAFLPWARGRKAPQ